MQTSDAQPKALPLGATKWRTITAIIPIAAANAENPPIQVAIDNGASEKSVIPSIAYLNIFQVDQSVVPAPRATVL